MLNREFPFEVDRMLPTSLTQQVFDGFVRAIEVGVYKPGDLLPTFHEVVERIGVSEIVVRAAYRKLASSGMVVSRPRIGTVVMPQRMPVWRGHVLCATIDFDFNFMQCGVIGPLRERLTGAGCLFSQVSVLRDKARLLDLTGLTKAFAHHVDFTIQTLADMEVSRRLSESGVPFVVVGGGDRERSLAGCVGVVGISYVRAIRDFVATCLKKRILTVEVVCCERLGRMSDMLMSAFEEAGISASVRWLGGISWGVGRTECAERKGYEFVVRNSRRRGFHLPDLYYVVDDYVARGMLMAFSDIGVRLPADVRVAILAQRGFTPVSGKSLAMVEFDPYAAGDEIARRVLSWLVRRRPLPASPIEARFVPGETLS